MLGCAGVEHAQTDFLMRTLSLALSALFMIASILAQVTDGATGIAAGVCAYMALIAFVWTALVAVAFPPGMQR